MNLGDTAHGVWLMEVHEVCVRETSSEEWMIDLHHLIRKCLAEPKSAQVAMQLLAGGIRDRLNGQSIAEAPKEAWSERLLIGCIYIAFVLSLVIGEEDGVTKVNASNFQFVPPVLKNILKLYPEILDCAVFVADWNKELLGELMSKPPSAE